MPQFDVPTYVSQFVWLALTFGVLYLVLSRMALPKIATVLELRHDRIASDLDEAETLKRQTDEAIAAYEQALAEARDDAARIARETRDEVKAEIDAARRKAEAEVAEKIGEAEARIAEAHASAMAEVNGIAAAATEDIVKSLVGGRVTKAEVTKAVKAALGQ